MAGYSVYINNSPVFVQSGSLQMQASVGKRSTASFTVRSDSGTHFQQYQQVQIYDQNNTLAFSGYIMRPREQKMGIKARLTHSITCTDQHFLADKRLVVASFTNRTVGEMVLSIANSILAQEGVSIGQIYDGLAPSPSLYPSNILYPQGNIGLVPSATFTYATVAQAFDELAKAASVTGTLYYWMIDQFKQLWFVPYTAIPNGTLVDGSQIEQYRRPPFVERQNPTYRNVQYLAGGVAQTAQQTEKRLGDNSTTTWTMGFDLASAPTITVDSGSGPVPKTVGVKGVSSGFDFYWQQGSADITQDSGAAKLINTQTLSVTYIGQYPAVIVSQNSAQIAYQKSIDGTSGIIESIDTDPTLTDIPSGLLEASQLLSLYAQQGLSLQFTTLSSGFVPGQSIVVNLPDHGISNQQMLISQVDAGDSIDGINIWYTVTAVLGPYDVSWVDFYKKLLAHTQMSNSINVGVSSTPTLLASFTVQMQPQINMRSFATSCPLPSTTLYPSATLYPC